MIKTLLPGHIASRIYNKPLLVSTAFLSVLAHVIEGNPLPTMETALRKTDPPEQNDALNVQNGASIIAVHDFLSYRSDDSFMSFLFGGTTYESIRAQFQASLADPAVKNIIFDINSPGGESSGLFDLVDEIYQARGAKPVYAVFNEEGFSAAFAIASAADKRYIARTGSAGSVGVVAMHVDQSGMDAQRGLVYTPIYAGARKIDYSSHAPLSPESLALAQEDINALYDIFVRTVARNLGITPEAVRATEAGIYQGKKAVEIGFADGVMSWNQFMGKLNNRKYGGIMKAEWETLFNEMRDKFRALSGANPEMANQEIITRADAEKLIAAAAESAKNEAYANGFNVGRAEGIEIGKTEYRTRAEAIMEICSLAKMDNAALGFLKDLSLGVEDVRQKVLEAQAEAADKKKIRSTVGALSTGDVNPLITDARKRAEAASIRIVK